MKHYNNLQAEMARLGLSQSDLAKKLHISPTSMNSKLNRKFSFTLDEAFKIQETIKAYRSSKNSIPEITIEYLFESTKVTV